MPITIILRKQELTLEDKSIQVKYALEKLGLSPESYLVVRNGELVNENETLREGETIRLVAAISGGCR
jgi:sulfur carrier protein